ncbi:MAG: DUF2784 domain-containing protein [Candidatus Aminicenantaceae bacterium]
MNELILQILDKFFFVFHSALILFNLLGWIWRRTRKLNLLVLFLTAFSWVFLGIWYGFGYCPSTDWHWQVRSRLGHHDIPHSYIRFLVETFTGMDVDAGLVDTAAVAGLGSAFAASVFTNIRDWKGRRKKNLF